MPRFYKRMKPSENKAITPGEVKTPQKDPPKDHKDTKKDGKDDKEGGGK